MPLYEYKCQSCGKTFEVIQKFSDEPLKTHPECGGPVEKLLSAPAFHLKGTGWYATDYGKGGVKPAKTDDSKAETKSDKNEAKSDKSDSGKTESSAPTADSKPAPAPAAESKPSSTSNPSSAA